MRGRWDGWNLVVNGDYWETYKTLREAQRAAESIDQNDPDQVDPGCAVQVVATCIPLEANDDA